MWMLAQGLPAEGSSQQLQPSSTHTAMVPCMAHEKAACSVVAHDCSHGRRAAAPIPQWWEQVCQAPHVSLTAVC